MNLSVSASYVFQEKTVYSAFSQKNKKTIASGANSLKSNDIGSLITLHYQRAQLKSHIEINDQAADFISMQTNTDIFIRIESQDNTFPPVRNNENAEVSFSDGYWGIEKTAARIAEFVINGAGDNLEKLNAGRAGMLKGFKEAESIWGGNLPDICHQTLNAALDTVDKQIQNLGGSSFETFA